jgi:NAD(P)-dependent dehydrogenase (short-subunit alcohol dehydrogenase family)
MRLPVHATTAAGPPRTQRFVAADLADAADVQWLASEAGEIDILINNAGISAFAPTAEFDAAIFEKMFASNVRARSCLWRRSLPEWRPAATAASSASAAWPVV